MSEINFEEIEDIDFERDGDNAQFNLFEWLDDEIKIQPKGLHAAIFNGESKLPINYTPGGLE